MNRRWIRHTCGPAVLMLVAVGITPSGSSVAEPSRAFMIHAFGGTTVKNGGKCLDYAEEVTGSPIVLNDCSASHPITVEEIPEHLGNDGRPRKHEVRLRAGTKVIGLRDPEPNLLDVAGASPTVRPAMPLELQNLAGSGVRRGDIGQLMPPQSFALDGDSILLADNHNQAAQVLGGRGANATPVVMAPRNVADAELWDFRAADGRDSDPTTGFRRVDSPGALLWEIASAEVDTVITISKSIDVTHIGIPPLPDGLTIRGDRRGTQLGPELRRDGTCDGCGVFVVANGPPTGLPVRITGLRIKGPSRDKNAQPLGGQHAIFAKNDLHTVIIDRNDLSDWPNAAIRVDRPPDRSTECNVPYEASPWTNVRVLRNFIHDNQADDFGYGVAVDGTATILGNTFLQNRHAITAAGSALSGYAAYANLTLTNVPTWYDKTFWPHGPQQDFDMHGFGPGSDSSHDGGYGGHRVDVAWNTFFGDDRTNFSLRGTPCTSTDEPDYFRNNVTTRDKDLTVWREKGALAYEYEFDGDIRVQQARFAAPTKGVLLRINDNEYGGDYGVPQPEDLRVGDFDGDGLDDLFMATQAAFFYSPGGVAEWRLLAGGRTDGAESLAFGDFDADGRTDVVGKNRGYLMVSWGGASDWEVLNFPQATGLDPPMRALAVGDFDGTGADDLFVADGTNWYVSYGGSAPFVPVQTSSFRTEDVRFGDFNGNGTTDVFGIVGDQWSFSDGATAAWQPLRHKLTDTVDDLFVADFDGDLRDDVATCDHGCYRFSRQGTEPWVMVTHLIQVTVAGIGHFSTRPNVDVLVFNYDKVIDPGVSTRVLYIAEAGVAGFRRHSRQEMT